MKVYVITKGSYSDYHICGVEIDKEKAEKIRGIMSDADGCEEACIEEFDTDQFNKQISGFDVYDVRFYRGGLTTCEKSFNDYGRLTAGSARGNLQHVFIATVEARDEKTAIKIAQDMRAEYLARKDNLV